MLYLLHVHILYFLQLWKMKIEKHLSLILESVLIFQENVYQNSNHIFTIRFSFKLIIQGTVKEKRKSLWAIVNLNLNKTCPVCTSLSDNSVYWPNPMVQYVSLTRHTTGVNFLSIVPSERSDYFLQYSA